MRGRARRQRMLPSEMPLKTRPMISPVESLLCTACSDFSASARTSASDSTNCPSFCSSTPSSSVLVFGLLLPASARIAASRVVRSVLASWIDACVSNNSDWTSASVSLASAAPIAGSMSSSAPLCNSLAAASRTARSGAFSRNEAIALINCLRTRLLTTTSSRLAGTGATAPPVKRSVALASAPAPLISSIWVSAIVWTSPFSSSCNIGSAAGSPPDTSALIAFSFASLSPSARSRIASGGTAPAAQCMIAHNADAMAKRMITTSNLYLPGHANATGGSG